MKVKINTYRISVTNRTGEKQILNYFNGEEDFFSIVNNYCTHIFQNIRNYTDNTGNLRTFTLDSMPTLVQTERYIYGYFDSAYTGEALSIKESQTNNVLFNVAPQNLQSRKFFFLISVPVNSQYAYLIIQRKANHGVKSILENSFSEYIRYLGFTDYRIHIEEAPGYYLLETMLERGRLKEVRLTQNNLMSSFQEQFNNTGVPNEGTFEKVFKFSKEARTQIFKQLLFRLYRANYAEYQQVNIEGENFNEVTFTMELNNLSKTFYVKDKAKIRSNIDVTDLVEIMNGEPTVESMIELALNIIERFRRRNNDEDGQEVA